MVMSKLFQNTSLKSVSVFCGSVALVALMSAAPVVPAQAYVPAGLLRLDPPQTSGGPYAEFRPHVKIHHSRHIQAH